MINLKKTSKYILKTIEDSGLTSKIQLFFSSKSVGSEYDPYEKNYTYTNQNPRTIKGYVTEIDPTKLIYKQYGLSELGMIDVICNSKYSDWFKICNKVEVNGKKYTVYKEATGNRAMITELPLKLIRVTLKKNE